MCVWGIPMEFTAGWGKRGRRSEEAGRAEEAASIQEVGFRTVLGGNRGGASGATAEQGGLAVPERHRHPATTGLLMQEEDLLPSDATEWGSESQSPSSGRR